MQFSSWTSFDTCVCASHCDMYEVRWLFINGQEKLPFSADESDGSKKRAGLCLSVNWKDVYLLLLISAATTHSAWRKEGEKCCKRNTQSSCREGLESVRNWIGKKEISFTSSKFINVDMEDMGHSSLRSFSAIHWLVAAVNAARNSSMLNLTCFIYVEFNNKVIGTSEGAKIFILFTSLVLPPTHRKCKRKKAQQTKPTRCRRPQQPHGALFYGPTSLWCCVSGVWGECEGDVEEIKAIIAFFNSFRHILYVLVFHDLNG